MSFYYIFQNGKIILKEDGAIPEAAEIDGLRQHFVNAGCVDKEDKDGDRWAELEVTAKLPDGFDACERRGCWTAVGEEQYVRIVKAFQ